MKFNYKLLKDGAVISIHENQTDDLAVCRELQRHSGMSAEYNFKVGGYAIECVEQHTGLILPYRECDAPTDLTAEQALYFLKEGVEVRVQGYGADNDEDMNQYSGVTMADYTEFDDEEIIECLQDYINDHGPSALQIWP